MHVVTGVFSFTGGCVGAPALSHDPRSRRKRLEVAVAGTVFRNEADALERRLPTQRFASPWAVVPELVLAETRAAGHAHPRRAAVSASAPAWAAG
jgi:hypothetical protein